MKVWRSGGWPCRDPLEIDLLAGGWVELRCPPGGHETLQLTPAGIAALAASRQRGQRALSLHDRLACRMSEQLMRQDGRIVWRELSLRAQVQAEASSPLRASSTPLFGEDLLDAPHEAAPKQPWRMARPDLFSVRNTSVAAYLQPVVHEIKASRADLQSDLRHAAKRESYQWLCSACYYVFPAGVAEPEELPPEFGVWVLHGEVETGRLELLRPARYQPCDLPFAVWMALAKATPDRLEGESPQAHLGEPGAQPEAALPGDPGSVA